MRESHAQCVRLGMSGAGTVRYGTVEPKYAESRTILAILGTTWSKDHLRLLLDSMLQ